MWPLLLGLETEYGLEVEGRGAEDQVDDSMGVVRSSPDSRHVGWDYRFESPRADLRGFRVDRLSFDPDDARFDQGRSRGSDHEVRSDRILANGARLYNDHGHPEYSSPECWSARELALQDLAGERAVLRAAQAFQAATGKAVRVVKNNTDHHGASYGTHESYLVPRGIEFARLYRCVTPVLVARQVVCGAGKVGSEAGPPVHYQISQRADFFTEAASVDTLYRRPVFNTRDEPHADRANWIRLHVICGDANRIAGCTARKVALVKLALWLEGLGEAPEWELTTPASSLAAVSRDLSGKGRIELARGWTEPRHVLESLVESATRHLDVGYPGVSEALELGTEAIRLLDDLESGGNLAAKKVDWVAKRRMIQSLLDEEGSDWSDPRLSAYDLAYHDVDPAHSLFGALSELGLVEAQPEGSEARLERVFEPTRARARSVAVRKFAEALVGVSWGDLTFQWDGGGVAAALPPDGCYPDSLEEASTVAEFVARLEEVR